jgi:hypothetical protein
MFRRSRTEPEPTPSPAAEQSPLAAALAEELMAARLCTETSQACERLDNEQRSWLERRERAMHDHNTALARHAAAKETRERLSKSVHVSGSVATTVIAAGTVDEEKN